MLPTSVFDLCQAYGPAAMTQDLRPVVGLVVVRLREASGMSPVQNVNRAPNGYWFRVCGASACLHYEKIRTLARTRCLTSCGLCLVSSVAGQLWGLSYNFQRMPKQGLATFSWAGDSMPEKHARLGGARGPTSPREADAGPN